MSTSVSLSSNIRRATTSDFSGLGMGNARKENKPSKHASMWNAMAARRAELGLNKVAVSIKRK